MNARCRVSAAIVLFFISAQPAGGDDQNSPELRLFDGRPRLLVVHGYSTSRQWPQVLQRKLDRYFEGRRVIEVRSVIRGGTPIAKWMNPETGEPSAAWVGRLRPALENNGERPVIVLAQQSLQWVFGERGAGIRSADDQERIAEGADVLRRYAERLLADGADEVFIAMHIYKTGMEPEIGNERLALAEYLKDEPEHVHAGPDVWEPTKELWPRAFANDRRHPNELGAEVMAQKWFEVLLEYDGLEVPVWSVTELQAAIDGGAPVETRSRLR